MATRYSPSIVTSGLVLCLDAADKNSYLGSGTSWRDLSGNNYTGTLTNGPTFNGANGGNIFFDGTDDFVSVGNIGVITSFTVLVWCYPTSVNSFRNILDCNFNYNATTGNIGPRLEMNSFTQLTWVYSNITNSNDSFYSHTVLNNGGFNANSWYCIGITYNSSGNTSTTYYNGYDTGISRSSNGTPTGFVGTMSNVILGKGFSLDNRLYAGRISNTLIYNRALSATEVLQNYNATKTRFGL